MLYKSTRGNVENCKFEEALFSGFTEDGGPFVPSEIPLISEQQLVSWKGQPYRKILNNLLELYIQESEISRNDLERIVENSFKNFSAPDMVPIKELYSGVYVAELFHGPTLAFKDLSLSIIGNLLSYFLTRRRRHIIILVATSGDTGSAAIQSVAGLDSIDIIVLYPKNRCNKIQELQMVTVQDRNVHCFTVDGTSDDFDHLIQHIFADWNFAKEHNLCSINSINWARVLVQVAHYIYIYLKLCVHVDEMVEFVVPTGGCGHISAGMLVQKMGLPIRITATVNMNDFVHHAVTDGNMSLQQTVHKTLASSMDIQVPLNFERILYIISDGDCSKVKVWMEEFGENHVNQLPKNITEKLHKVLKSFRADNLTIVSTIKRCWTENKYYICPHTATSLAYIYHNFKEILSKWSASSSVTKYVCLATASPAKFPEAADAAGIPRPDSHLEEELQQLPTRCDYMRKEDDWNDIIRKKICQLTSLYNKKE
ncbi:threonine synthase-like 2 [Tachypleus tridentatus]|uniref:threonine synthase-like 2 n=1 Tax=Tachypleus tridentatus TaxID=6853 RepID=UPI003FD2D0DF